MPSFLRHLSALKEFSQPSPCQSHRGRTPDRTGNITDKKILAVGCQKQGIRVSKMLGNLLVSGALVIPQIVLLSAPAHAVDICGTPGKDASPTISGVVNTYYPGSATASIGATSITLGAAIGSTTGITTGDMLLVIQMQDADINATNTDAYGDGISGAPASGSTNLNTAGLYQYVVATNSVGTGGGTLTIQQPLVATYTNLDATTTSGQRRFQVIRIPQYQNVTISGTVSAQAWNGRAGGVVSFDVRGNLTFSGGAIDVSGQGFRGGGGVNVTGTGIANSTANTDYVSLSTNPYSASKGEGIAGTPRYIRNDVSTTVTNTGIEGYANGSFSRGAPANAGGGGTDPSTQSNSDNTGGGGGANYGSGGRGGDSWPDKIPTRQTVGGYGGAPFSTTVNRVIMGGGAGAGSSNNSTSGTVPSGGGGGGIVMVRTNQVLGNGSIRATGISGVSPSSTDGGGGGGAGGTVLIQAVTASSPTLAIDVQGGRGLDSGYFNHGPGGGGGGGYVAYQGIAPTTTVTGGIPGNDKPGGTVNAAADPYGATAGQDGLATSTSIPIAEVYPGALCVVTVSGTVFNDINGGTINGTGTNAGGLTAYIVSVSSSNTVAKATVAADGTYSLPNIPPSTYTLRISTDATGVIGAAPPAVALPANYASTGEGVGASPTTADATVNSITDITVGPTNLTNVNFGIQQRPTAQNNANVSQTNPGGTIQLPVAATSFTTNATDPDGGTIASYQISFPTGADSITVNGTSYSATTFATAFPAGFAVVPVANIGNITVDPTGTGNTSVVIPFRPVDNAGFASSTQHSATVPFTTSVSVSGTVFNDIDGGTINGTGTNGGGLTAYIVSGSTTIAKATVAADGTYNIPAIAPGAYTVRISTDTTGAIGAAPPTVSLPTNYVNTGEGVGASPTTTDGAVDGITTVTVAATAVTDVNFGIKARPNLRLVKRITQIQAATLTNYIDVVIGTSATDDNAANWFSPTATATKSDNSGTTANFSSLLRGVIDGNSLPVAQRPKPNDEVEYSIYFLSDGATNANNVSLCDFIPANTSYVPGSLQLVLGAAAPIAITDTTADADGGYYPSGFPAACTGTNNGKGAIVVNVGTVNFATAPGIPTSSYGYIRFRSKVN